MGRFCWNWLGARLLVGAVLLCGALGGGVAGAQEVALVSPGEARSAEEQRGLFRLPEGFEIQLVASEPAIGKPMNLQFDAGGRLWVTSSVEYPYPADGPGVEPREERFASRAEAGPPRDRLVVLSDFGEDGRARSIETFVEGLNIPIGHLPVARGALVYSIPTLSRYEDRDGDGVAEHSEVVLRGFGNIDTHGMVNALRWGMDGWIYACHGFRNRSEIEGSDGKRLTLDSGNIFRFRPDGSGLEQVAWGQVNPFGLTWDPRGDLYSADCHSSPLTCVLWGAYYPSFGKPDDGLGMGPRMIDHQHGSTGICGPAYYAADHFPAAYRDNMFLCNPVTGRVHRDRITWRGSSPRAETQEDFVTCEDHWFRPVDLAVGPDGALYIADFYNAVIGHYEVPLDHPKRDRSRGRIWRVVYRGEGATLGKVPDLEQAGEAELIAAMGAGNFSVRQLALQEIVARGTEAARPLLERVLNGAEAFEDDVAGRRAMALWALHRRGWLSAELRARAFRDEESLVRVHLARVLGDIEEWGEAERELGTALLGDEDAFVRRAAAEAVGRRGGMEATRQLLDVLRETAPDDTHLRHALRIALKGVLTRGLKDGFDVARWSADDQKVIAEILLAVRTEAGAGLLGRFLITGWEGGAEVVVNNRELAAVEQVLRFGSPGVTDELMERMRAGEGVEDVLPLIDVARRARAARDLPPGETLEGWAREVARGLLAEAAEPGGWMVEGAEGTATWVPEQRKLADGRQAWMWSSLPPGERRTGVLRSMPFEIPKLFRFWVAGHAGFPTAAAHGKNVVRLVDAETQEELRRVEAPRNDVGRRIEWEMGELAGRRGYVELVDGDAGAAYAWLAAGGFDIAALGVDRALAGERGASLVRDFRMEELRPELCGLVRNQTLTPRTRTAAGSALVALSGDEVNRALVPFLGNERLPEELREEIAREIAPEGEKSAEGERLIERLVRHLSAAGQLSLAERLAESPKGGEELLRLVQRGQASGRLLLQPSVRLRLEALKLEGLGERIASLTENLPQLDEANAGRIAVTIAGFQSKPGDAGRGAALFTTHCANCHRIGTTGAMVGPQLDGVGVRGLERLVEDVLDPNRNVDGAFRSSTLVMEDGRVLTGLVRREEGETLILADQAGKEFSVPTAEIDERVGSAISLMPSNWSEILTEAELRDLLAYLLAQRGGGEAVMVSRTPTIIFRLYG